MSTLARITRNFVRDDSGATMVEYGVMVALIAAVCIAIISSLGTKVDTAFTTVDAKLP